MSGHLGKHLDKKNDRYSIGSRRKLRAAMAHKIRRTFAGALDAIEIELDRLDVSETDRESFKDKARRRILRIGNDQIRNMENELDKYNVEFIPYHVEFVFGESNEG